jgi:hypothetical protein
MGMDIEKDDDHEHNKTLNFSFGEDNSGQAPAFGGAGSGAATSNNESTKKINGMQPTKKFQDNKKIEKKSYPNVLEDDFDEASLPAKTEYSEFDS